MNKLTKSKTQLWQDADFQSAPHTFGVDDEALGFPHGTLQVLATAFSLQLTRKTAWDLHKLSLDWQVAARAAAKIYKRGVTLIGDQDSGQDLATQQISDIQFQSEPLHLETLPPSLKNKKIFVIIDSKITLPVSSLAAAKQGVFSLDANEQDKSLATVAKILAQLKKHYAEALLVVGGGLTLDIGGFVGYLCHLPTFYYPTTLLAMVDAAIGGKTAVNVSSYGKNQIGAFYQPTAITVCKPFLATLPKRQWLSGAAECFKHLLLEHQYSELGAFSKVIADQDVDSVFSLLPTLIKTKVQIVERDPYEKNERALLNFGHTIAHGLESALNYQISHGEAVLLGMATELLLSHELGFLEKDKVELSMQAFDESGICSELTEIIPLDHAQLFAKMLPFMRQDKKSSEATLDSLPCILLGRAVAEQNYVSQVPADQVAKAFQKTLDRLKT